MPKKPFNGDEFEIASYLKLWSQELLGKINEREESDKKFSFENFIVEIINGIDEILKIFLHKERKDADT